LVDEEKSGSNGYGDVKVEATEPIWEQRPPIRRAFVANCGSLKCKGESLPSHAEVKNETLAAANEEKEHCTNVHVNHIQDLSTLASTEDQSKEEH
jgi:hypothetical protein